MALVALVLGLALVDLMGTDSRIRAAVAALVDRDARRPPVQRVLDELRR